MKVIMEALESMLHESTFMPGGKVARPELFASGGATKNTSPHCSRWRPPRLSSFLPRHDHVTSCPIPATSTAGWPSTRRGGRGDSCETISTMSLGGEMQLRRKRREEKFLQTNTFSCGTLSLLNGFLNAAAAAAAKGKRT